MYVLGLSNSAARQRNIKQKFVALLKRFKVTEPEDLKGNTEQNSQLNDIDPEEIEDLLDMIEDNSDYGPDIDTASVGSTPKPSLRPFFSSSRSLIRDTLDKNPYSIMEKPELGSDHMSDDSSKGSYWRQHFKLFQSTHFIQFIFVCMALTRITTQRIHF